MKARLFGYLAALVALCATTVVSADEEAPAPAKPAAPAAWRTVERRAWKMSMPADWKLESSIYYGEDGERATWRFESPTRNWLLTVRVEKDEKQPLKDLAAWRWANLEGEAEEVETLEEKAEVIDGRELVFRISQAAKTRNTNVHPYVVLGIYTRSQSKPVLIGITLKGTDEKVDAFMDVALKMLTSLTLNGLPPPPVKPAATKKGG